jgi:hypothetical protein
MPRKPDDPLAFLRRLTPRDKQLLAWLADHQTLTTKQIGAALFSSLRSAQRRLLTLHGVRLVDRFTFARPADNGEMRYTLGPLGAQFQTGETSRTLLSRQLALARNPRLDHLLAVNGFFTDLASHARTHPETDLRRWWSEKQATNVYSLAGIRPDGHGIWHADGVTVGFFLEHDRGTEDHHRLLRKLVGYQRLAGRGPRYPILFHLPNHQREANLHAHLAELPTRTGTAIVIATAVHGVEPADAVWWLAGHHQPDRRLRLHELPSHHGPIGIDNPHRYTDPTP